MDFVSDGIPCINARGSFWYSGKASSEQQEVNAPLYIDNPEIGPTDTMYSAGSSSLSRF